MMSPNYFTALPIVFFSPDTILLLKSKNLIPGALPPVKSRQAAPPKSNQPLVQPQHLQGSFA
jgi:hypothetical protein